MLKVTGKASTFSATAGCREDEHCRKHERENFDSMYFIIKLLLCFVVDKRTTESKKNPKIVTTI